jgi:hypothetical protein
MNDFSGEDTPLSRGHVHPVALPAQLDIGIARLRGQLENGKSSAILLMITEGLNARKLIEPETYKIFSKRYSRKLQDIIEENKKNRENSHLSKFEIERRKNEEKELYQIQCQNGLLKQEEEIAQQQVDKTLKGMLEQWETHNLNWRIKAIGYAKKHTESPYSPLLVAKEKEGELPAKEIS